MPSSSLVPGLVEKVQKHMRESTAETIVVFFFVI